MSKLTIDRLIGSGGYGVVYLARWKNIPCAVKRFYSRNTEPVEREIKVLRQLRHPHIIQFLDTHYMGDTLYVVMQLAEMGSLANVIDKGKLHDWPDKIRIADEIARGLEYIHMEGVIHRNLKSPNILLTKSMEVKLSSFGLSMQIPSGATSTSDSNEKLVGTIRWMAPELFETRPQYSTKSDMYTFGMVLWEMAANSTIPFKHILDNVFLVDMLENGEREKIPADAPSEYRTWIERCWEQDPKCRPEASEVVFTSSEQETYIFDTQDSSISLGSLSLSDWLNYSDSTDTEELPPHGLAADSQASRSILSGDGTSLDSPPLRQTDIDTAPNTSASVLASSPTVTLTLGAHIGSGGFGSVYRGTWGIREVAVKKLNVTKDEAKQEIKVQNEINMLQRLQDRHVIQFLGTDYHDGMLVIIMDYAEGGNLTNAIKQCKFEWPDKIRIAQEMIRGLAFIHEQKVLHRDLKSLNVLLTRQMEVKLCDFGLATVRTASISKTSGNVGLEGTIQWMAPELFARRPKYSTKSDMYALGMVMWEMAANCTKPFKDQTNSHMVMLLIERGDREDIPDDTPADYRAWIERCWHQDPTKRPDAAEIVMESQPVKIDKLIGGDDKSTSYLSFTFGVSRMSIASPSSVNAPTNDASA